MSKTRFIVFTTGFQADRDPEAALLELAFLLDRDDPQALQKYLEPGQRVVQVTDDERQAMSLRDKIRDIGFACDTKPESSPASRDEETDSSSAKPGSEHDLGTYEMMWDCEYCGTTKLLGLSHRFCPTCASPQDPNRRYFPSEEDKVAVKDHIYQGVDRVCPACSTPSSAVAEFCPQCGHPLTDAAQAKLHSMDKDRAKMPSAPPGPAAPPKKGIRNKVLGGAGVAVAGVVTAIFWTNEVNVTLDGHSWSREIKIEDFASRSESAWCDGMPHDAYRITRREEIRSHTQVPDGQECSVKKVDQGDGSFRQVERCHTKYRDQPVYDDKCYYSVDRWKYERSITAEGKDKTPYWPDVELARSGQCIGCEREGSRIQTYLVSLKGPEEEFTCPMDENRWQNSVKGSKWRMDVGVVAGGARCDSLQPVQ